MLFSTLLFSFGSLAENDPVTGEIDPFASPAVDAACEEQLFKRRDRRLKKLSKLKLVDVENEEFTSAEKSALNLPDELFLVFEKAIDKARKLSEVFLNYSLVKESRLTEIDILVNEIEQFIPSVRTELRKMAKSQAEVESEGAAASSEKQREHISTARNMAEAFLGRIFSLHRLAVLQLAITSKLESIYPNTNVQFRFASELPTELSFDLLMSLYSSHGFSRGSVHLSSSPNEDSLWITYDAHRAHELIHLRQVYAHLNKDKRDADSSKETLFIDFELGAKVGQTSVSKTREAAMSITIKPSFVFSSDYQDDQVIRLQEFMLEMDSSTLLPTPLSGYVAADELRLGSILSKDKLKRVITEHRPTALALHDAVMNFSSEAVNRQIALFRRAISQKLQDQSIEDGEKLIAIDLLLRSFRNPNIGHPDLFSILISVDEDLFRRYLELHSYLFLLDIVDVFDQEAAVLAFAVLPLSQLQRYSTEGSDLTLLPLFNNRLLRVLSMYKSEKNLGADEILKTDSSLWSTETSYIFTGNELEQESSVGSKILFTRIVEMLNANTKKRLQYIVPNRYDMKIETAVRARYAVNSSPDHGLQKVADTFSIGQGPTPIMYRSQLADPAFSDLKPEHFYFYPVEVKVVDGDI